MNINPKSIICGLPAIKARDLMKFYQDHGFNTYSFKERLKDRYKIKGNQANDIFNEFSDTGYINKSDNTWGVTLKGAQLALASAAKRFKRKSVDKAYKDFMGRVSEINKDDNYLYKVEKVVVFGSYLSDKEYLSDLDLAIRLTSKFKTDEGELFGYKCEQKTKLAQKNGRRFGNIAEYYSWPQTEVLLRLKNRSAIISLHYIDQDEEIIETTCHKIVYDTNAEIA